MAVILDSNFYLSLVHPKDPNAEDGKRLLLELAEGSHGLLYSSNLVVSEASTLIAVRTRNNEKAINHLGSLIWGDRKIAIELLVDLDTEKEIWQLFRKINKEFVSKKEIYSFVDTSLLVLAQQHKINSIVSFDSHFQGFVNVLQ